MTRDELIDAMQDMLSGWKYIRQSHGDLYGVGWDRAQEKMEKALAALSSATPAVEVDDARDASRWRRLVNASEMAFPVATIVDDPENDKIVLYGRKRLEDLIDSCDEISNSYTAALAASPAPMSDTGAKEVPIAVLRRAFLASDGTLPDLIGHFCNEWNASIASTPPQSAPQEASKVEPVADEHCRWSDQGGEP